MLTLPDKFKQENEKQPNRPAFIAKIVTSEEKAEVSTQSDWQDNNGAVNVDLDTSPGSVLVAEGSAIAPITQASGSSYFPLATSVGYDYDGEAWQSFKQVTGISILLKAIKVRTYITGPVRAYFTVRVYASDKTTPLSSARTISATSTYDGYMTFDFSSDDISLANNTTYWFQVTSQVYSNRWAGAAGVKYTSTTTAYANGQFDGKTYAESSITANRGDLVFEVSFMSVYQDEAIIEKLLDLGSVATNPGEWRVDKLTPSDSAIDIQGYIVDPYTWSVSGDSLPTAFAEMRQNGRTIVGVPLSSSGYCYISRDGGETWSAKAMPSTQVWKSVAWNGSRWCILGTTHTAVSDDDGDTWSTQYVMPTLTNGAWARIFSAKNSAVFIATWYDTSAGHGPVSTVYTSPAGQTWTARTMPSSQHWEVAVAGFDGTNYVLVMGDAAARSTNGTSWSAATTAPAGSSPRNIVHNGQGFMAMGYYGGLVLWSSDGGVNWTTKSGSLPGSRNYSEVAWNGIEWHVLDHAYQNHYTSTDNGTTWTLRNAIGGGYYKYPRWLMWTKGRLFAIKDGAYTEKYFTSRTSLGTISDGDPITSLARYYYFVATLTPDTGSLAWTPELRSVSVSFSEWMAISDRPDWGYEPSLIDVASLQTTIGTFSPSTVGQISIKTAHTKTLSNFIANGYPRNREVRIFAGFSAPGFLEDDFIDYYRGKIEDWNIDANEQINWKLQDFTKDWKGVPVPTTWQIAGTPPAGDDKTWENTHRVDVMLDIMTGYIGMPSKAYDSQSFTDVKAATSGDNVTRTLTGKTFDAKDLMEELRMGGRSFFIPRADGKIRLKLWDPDEAAVAELSDKEMIGLTYDGNASSLLNVVYIYYNLNSDDTARDDVTIALQDNVDLDSIANWNESKIKQIKDYWADATQGGYVEARANSLIARYKDIPAIINFALDRRFIALEVGDIVSVTTKRAPSADMTGISNVKFQIVSKNLDLKRDRIPMKALRVA